MKKTFRYFWLSIAAIMDMFLILFLLIGLAIDSGQKPHSVFILLSDGILILCGIILLIISINGFIRTTRDKEKVLISGFLMKATTVCVSLGLFYILWDFQYIVAGVFFTITGALLGTVTYHYCKKKKKFVDSRKRYYSNISLTDEDVNKVAAEYCERYCRSNSELSYEDNRRIYRFAGTSIAMLFLWLLRHDYFSDEFINQYSKEEIEELKDLRINPVTFLDKMYEGNVFFIDLKDVSDEVRDFLEKYCSDSFISNYNNHELKYIGFSADYYRAIRNDNKILYCVNYSTDNYLKLEQIIDFRHLDYMSIHDYHMNPVYKIKGRYENNIIDVLAQDGVEFDYIMKCANHVEALLGGLNKEVLNATYEELSFYELSEDKTEFLISLHPEKVYIFKPFGEEVAYALVCNPDFEIEHGCAVMVRDNVVVNAGYYDDCDNPWCYYLQKEYYAKKTKNYLSPLDITTKEKLYQYVKNGKLCEVKKIPDLYGHDNDEIIYLPKYIAELKEEYDELIEFLYLTGKIDEYKCELVYYSDSLIPGIFKIILSKECDDILIIPIHIWYGEE